MIVLLGLIAIYSGNEFLVPTTLGSVMEDPPTFVARITLCEECVVLIRKDGLPFFRLYWCLFYVAFQFFGRKCLAQVEASRTSKITLLFDLWWSRRTHWHLLIGNIFMTWDPLRL